MADQLTRDQLHQFARIGAAARLAQIDAEVAAIKTAFPDLAGAQQAAAAAPAPLARKAPKAARKAAGRKREWSEAERQEVSQRMRRYWAERRKAKKAAK